jgi:hypothetical protein
MSDAFADAVGDERTADAPEDDGRAKKAKRPASSRRQKRAAVEAAPLELNSPETFDAFTSMVLACQSLAGLLPLTSSDSSADHAKEHATGTNGRKGKSKTKKSRAPVAPEMDGFTEEAVGSDHVLPEDALVTLLDKAPSIKVFY